MFCSVDLYHIIHYPECDIRSVFIAYKFIFDNNCIDGYGASRIARLINENINETIDTKN